MKENKKLDNVTVLPAKEQKKEQPMQEVELDDFLQADEEFSGDLTFKIENFEGPLDVLLHLIKKSKLEIEDVKLSEITEQYLEIMNQIDQVDLELASEFIEVAATLIEIKSKALLPKLLEADMDEEDPEALLLQRLQEYKLFKETIEQLKPMESTDRFYKEPEPDASKYRIVIKDMSLDMLLDAFTNILTRVTIKEKDVKPKEVTREVFTVSNKIAAIKDALVVQKQVRFFQLFEQSSTRDEVITIFLALLELLKLQEVKVQQGDSFEDIEITKAETNNG